MKESSPPVNDIKATHWAELPDGQVIYYRIEKTILIWLPMSKVWGSLCLHLTHYIVLMISNKRYELARTKTNTQ